MRWIVPEVVQTSAMDCGPAALRCLLEGFGVATSYARLREACHTDVDGTSIDTLEDVAVQLGLDAQQVVVPADHVLLPESRCLPALVVTRLPGGVPHFVVAWRKHGPLVQLMDPASGRRWASSRELLDELYAHEMPIAASAWRRIACADERRDVHDRRLAALGVASDSRRTLWKDAIADDGWRSLAALDAAIRLVAELVRLGGVARGTEAASMVRSLFDGAREANGEGPVPRRYWMAWPTGADAQGTERVLMRGAVIVRVSGKRATADDGPEDAPGPLSPDVAAALRVDAVRPIGRLWRLMRQDGLLAPASLVLGLLLGAMVVPIEALLFRGFFEVGEVVTLPDHRLAAMAVLLTLVVALLALEIPLAAGALRLGRHLEARLRVAFLSKVPRLGDRYFRTRLTSDLVERAHAVHLLRGLPALGTELLRSAFGLLATVAGIAWIDPGSAPVAAVAALISVALPWGAQRMLAERDLRVRTHLGALSGFYLDAMIGLVAIRAHGAEDAIRREQESLLVEWERAGLGMQKAVVAVEALCAATGLGLAAWLLSDHVGRVGETGMVLLLVYWALNVPVLGERLALAARQYPALRNVTLRLLEPLGAPEDEVASGSEEREPPAAPSSGAQIELRKATVTAGGHVILDGIDLELAPTTHVAIVGPSGAGKTSLVGLLLGWHRAAGGEVFVDDAPLDAGRLDALRRETAWVDPAVQLWNRTLSDNLRYGARDEVQSLADVVGEAELRPVLDRLPDGLQTVLGDAGALVSGGEGQRVRLGRALLRPKPRLVILDEPFRGLGRDARKRLLARVRERWAHATLVCVTHDVSDTRDFERVVVMEGGRIVEDGVPAELAVRPGTRYARMLAAEAAVRTKLFEGDGWRRVRLEGGELREAGHAS